MHPPVSDPTAPAAPTPFEALADRWLAPYLVDARDVVFTRLLARGAAQLLPLTIALYALPTPWLLAAGLPYLVFLFVGFGGPVILGLHAVTHRPLFKRPYRRFTPLLTHVMPIFLGLPPFAYHAHHVQMHHTAGNSEDDLSGTAQYQRDNPLHFLHYWARFTFFGYFHLASWLIRAGKGSQLPKILGGDLAVFTVMGLLTWWNPLATTIAFWIPFALLRFFLMAGNWTEHAFVDVDAPDDSWRNSTNLLNTPYNHRAYNAGYHLIHHLVPGLHWADAPAAYQKRLGDLAAHDSIAFDGIRNNQAIWWRLMRKDYGYLADHLVDAGGRRPTREAKIAFLKERTQRTTGQRKGLVERRERREVA